MGFRGTNLVQFASMLQRDWLCLKLGNRCERREAGDVGASKTKVAGLAGSIDLKTFVNAPIACWSSHSAARVGVGSHIDRVRRILPELSVRA